MRYFATKLDDMPKMLTEYNKPNYQTITKFQQKLDTNLLAVPSDTCTLSYLAIVVKDNKFAKLNDRQSFNIPQDPGLKPILILKQGSTKEQQAMMLFMVAKTLQAFKYKKEEYTKYLTTKNVVHNMVMNTVDDKYICHLKHKHMMYQKVESIILLANLWTTYKAIMMAT